MNTPPTALKGYNPLPGDYFPQAAKDEDSLPELEKAWIVHLREGGDIPCNIGFFVPYHIAPVMLVPLPNIEARGIVMILSCNGVVFEVTERSRVR